MKTRACVTLVAALIAACTNPSESVEKLKAESEALRMDIEILKVDAATNELRLSALEGVKRVQPATVTLGTGYGTAITDIGATLLVSWVDSKPQGDGTLIALRIGNPYAAQFDGLKIDAMHYAPGDPNAEKLWQRDPILKGSAEATITEAIRPGKWNNVTFRIPGVKPEEITMLGITLTPDVLSLTK